MPMAEKPGDETVGEARRDHPGGSGDNTGGGKGPKNDHLLTFGRAPMAATTHKDAEDPGGSKAPGMDRS